MTDLEHAWHPSAGNPRLAHCLLEGMAELNALYPQRPQGPQEGTIGDTNHLSEGWQNSDHNPWVVDAQGQGVVRAWDIQVLNAPFNAQALADHLASLMRGRAKFFGSRGYVIYNGRITAWQPWATWQPYTGPDPHREHIHVSVGTGQDEYDNTTSWGLAALAHPAPPPPVRPITVDEATIQRLLRATALDLNLHTIAYAGPRLVRFPRSKAPTAIYAWDGATLLWLPPTDYQALGSLHVVDVVDHANSNIYKCPVVAGTRDPRK